MKQLIAIIFLAGLLFQNLSRLAILADFNLNNKYITENFCENKSKPEMHCNGKCYLAKKIQEEESQKVPGGQKTIPDIQLFPAKEGVVIYPATGSIISSSYGSYNILHTISLSNTVFRPPLV